MLRPIHIAVLHAKHLTLSATGCKCRDDPIVHRRSRPLVFGRVHRQTRGEQCLLFVAVNPSIPLRLVAGSDADTETMKRTRREQRRILKAAPIDRRSQNAESTVHGRDFVSLPERGLEPRDLWCLLESYHRKLAERCFQRLDMTADRVRALE